MEQQPQLNCYYLGKLYPLLVEIDLAIKKIIIHWDGQAFICTSPPVGDSGKNQRGVERK